MDSSPPRKRQRICFTRGRGRPVRQKGDSDGQAAEQNQEIILAQDDQAEQHDTQVINFNDSVDGSVAVYEDYDQSFNELYERLDALHDKYETMLEQRYAESQAHFSDLIDSKISERKLAVMLDCEKAAARRQLTTAEEQIKRAGDWNERLGCLCLLGVMMAVVLNLKQWL